MIVIYNPVAGRRKRERFARVLAALEAAGAAVEVRETRAPGDARAIAAALAPADGIVAAAGGDGTAAEAADGLLRNPDRARLALGVIPLGTANVLAREIGLPRAPEALARVLLGGGRMDVRPGLLCPEGAEPRAFLLMASAGFDARTVARVRPAAKRRLGGLAYVLAGLSEAFAPPSPPLRVEADGREFSARIAVAARARRYGGPFVLAPEAGLERSGFAVVLLPRDDPPALLRYSLGLMSGWGCLLRDAIRLPAAGIRISAAGNAPLQADGDAAGQLPAVIRPAGETLALIVPETGK